MHGVARKNSIMIEKRLMSVFRDAFPSLVDADDETVKCATVESVEDWESITLLNLLILLEGEFEIAIPDDVAVDCVSYLFIEEYLSSNAS